MQGLLLQLLGPTAKAPGFPPGLLSAPGQDRGAGVDRAFMLELLASMGEQCSLQAPGKGAGAWARFLNLLQVVSTGGEDDGLAHDIPSAAPPLYGGAAEEEAKELLAGLTPEQWQPWLGQMLDRGGDRELPGPFDPGSGAEAAERKMAENGSLLAQEQGFWPREAVLSRAEQGPIPAMEDAKGSSPDVELAAPATVVPKNQIPGRETAVAPASEDLPQPEPTAKSHIPTGSPDPEPKASDRHPAGHMKPWPTGKYGAPQEAAPGEVADPVRLVRPHPGEQGGTDPEHRLSINVKSPADLAWHQSRSGDPELKGRGQGDLDLGGEREDPAAGRFANRSYGQAPITGMTEQPWTNLPGWRGIMAQQPVLEADLETVNGRLEDIVARAHLAQRQGETQLDLQLRPEVLGRLRIELVQRDGELQARFLTSTLAARDLLQSQLPALQAMLAQPLRPDSPMDQRVNVSVEWQEAANPREEQPRHHSREQGFSDSGKREAPGEGTGPGQEPDPGVAPLEAGIDYSV